MINPNNDDRIITKYRDKMLLERLKILNDYAKQTLDKGQMYYIYDKNSKMQDGYNLCICEEGKSHIIIEASQEELPVEAQMGSVLRKNGDSYILDDEATLEIAKELYNLNDEILKEQTEFLESKRIEGHIYEMSENGRDRAWLFDITDESSNGGEEVEEIDFPKELLQDANEGDLFIYDDWEYKEYISEMWNKICFTFFSKKLVY